MDKDQIERLAGDPRFVSAIYNYCERWCERRKITSLCMNYGLSEEEFDSTESRDIHNLTRQNPP